MPTKRMWGRGHRRAGRRRMRAVEAVPSGRASGRTAQEEVDAGGGHDHVATLVPELHGRANDAAVGLAPGRRGLDDGQAGGERVARAYGFHPAEVVDARRSETRRVLEEAVVEQPHERAAGVPAARDEAS